MDDDELAGALAKLGLARHNWRAIALLPLIEVAWADGRVQPAERALLVEVAQRYGIDPGGPFLQRWLGKKPAKADFLRARTLLMQLWRRAEPSDIKQPETLEQLLDLCLRVAEAAGGLFGILFTVESSERECMAEIASSLQLGPELPETVARAWRPPKLVSSSPQAAEAPTRVLKLPRPAAVSEEETTRIRPPRRPSKRSKGDADATTQQLPRPPVHLGARSFDEDVTSPYLDVDVDPEDDGHLAE